jgi:hypothetical protein
VGKCAKTDESRDLGHSYSAHFLVAGLRVARWKVNPEVGRKMSRIRAVELAAALIAFTVSVCSAMQAATTAVVQTTGTVTVSGRVTTSDGKPVSDARVYVPGSN